MSFSPYTVYTSAAFRGQLSAQLELLPLSIKGRPTKAIYEKVGTPEKNKENFGNLILQELGT